MRNHGPELDLTGAHKMLPPSGALKLLPWQNPSFIFYFYFSNCLLKTIKMEQSEMLEALPRGRRILSYQCRTPQIRR